MWAKKGSIIRTAAGCHYETTSNVSYRGCSADIKFPNPDLGLKVARKLPTYRHTDTTNCTIVYTPEQLEQLKEQKVKNMLYQIKDTTNATGFTYGNKLAVNSAGQWVMEEKGSGKILTVVGTDCEEVKPHTIKVRFNGKMEEFLAEKDKFNVGEFYIYQEASNLCIAKVEAVDTKANATREFKHQGKVVVQ